MSFEPCPDFDLSALQSFACEALVTPPDPADGFIIAMATAFNDLKTIMWLVEQLNKGKPDNLGEVNAYNGQWQGMQGHATRMMLALIHEILVAIDEAGPSVLESATMTSAVATLSTASNVAWANLVEAAAARNSNDPMRKFLVRVRNVIAAHYSNPGEFLKGYAAFRSPPKTAFNEAAHVSLGKSLERTRFYFADAAVQAYQNQLDPSGELFRMANEASRNVNQALRNLVHAYIEVKVSSTTSAG